VLSRVIADMTKVQKILGGLPYVWTSPQLRGLPGSGTGAALALLSQVDRRDHPTVVPNCVTAPVLSELCGIFLWVLLFDVIEGKRQATRSLACGSLHSKSRGFCVMDIM
jgi:hypothetical protein